MDGGGFNENVFQIKPPLNPPAIHCANAQNAASVPKQRHTHSHTQTMLSIASIRPRAKPCRRLSSNLMTAQLRSAVQSRHASSSHGMLRQTMPSLTVLCVSEANVVSDSSNAGRSPAPAAAVVIRLASLSMTRISLSGVMLSVLLCVRSGL